MVTDGQPFADLPVVECHCPSHSNDPTTTEVFCRKICRDYVTRLPEPCEPLEEISETACTACMIHHFQGEQQPMPDGWGSWQVTHDAHRVLLDECAAKLNITKNAPTGNGRGIVIGAGGAKYFACAMTSVLVLRNMGCKLPVEFWHLGDSEFDPQMQKIAEAEGIRCVNAQEVRKQHPMRILNGFELKPFSVLHSSFQHVLYLDADSIPTRDPEYMFESEPYKQTGAVFWPDVPPCEKNWSKKLGYATEWLPETCWNNFGLGYRNEPAFESGQFLVDKERCWRALALTAHVNSHSDWYFHFLFGDKDTFHLCWRKMGYDYGMPSDLPGGGFAGLMQHDFSGRALFQHCTQCKEDVCERRRIAGLRNADLVVDMGNELHRRWSGQVWRFEDQTQEENTLARELAGRYRYVRMLDKPVQRFLRLELSGWISEGREQCEQRWTVRMLHGAPALVIVGTAHKRQEIGLAIYRRDGDAWRGRWEAHERCECILERVSS